MMKTKTNRLNASFRDPNGFLFEANGTLCRQINQSYAANYRMLMDSGLYAKLAKTELIIPHTEADIQPEGDEGFKIICPERVNFISYPYEWSFDQLKDAALVTLSIQKRALKLGMSLKDASAYNIQFHHGKAILIDTLSFEVYKEGEPWVAYRQFCQHFLATLALMAYRDVRLNQLLRVYIDGVPLDLASKLLPRRTRLNLGLSAHIHLHAMAQKRYEDVSVVEARSGRKMSKDALLGLVDSLRDTVKKLKWEPDGTAWGDYYSDNNYSDLAFEHKKVLVADWLVKINPKTVWDLGANTGVFSRLVKNEDAYVISSDIDAGAVEVNYLQVKEQNEKNILPLLLDLTNPSPSIGWQNQERDSFLQRGPVDVVLALALVHHLAIANNVPLEFLADFFAICGEWLVIEFIPKSDSQVQKLLRNREDIFTDYSRPGFEKAMGSKFNIQEFSAIRDSDRWLYLMRRK
jgi:ribosomal protein L11 methylase PrmA